MKILNRLPIGEEPQTVMVGSEPVLIRRDQIAAWVRLREPSFPGAGKKCREPVLKNG